jgi:hypothetical protein
VFFEVPGGSCHRPAADSVVYAKRAMTRFVARTPVLALAAVVAFNVAMMVAWPAAGPSRDALVVAGWIAGDAVLCVIALFITDP